MKITEKHKWNGQPVTVEFDYQPGEKEIWTLSNGDPGHPGCPEEIEILRILWETKDIKGNSVIVDVYDILPDSEIEQIEAMMYERKNDY